LQHPLGYHKTYVRFVIPIHVTTYVERLTKIGLVVAGRYADFCCLVQKGAVVTLTISGVILPNVTKIVYNVQKFILFNILKSELQYCNPLWNGSATKDIGP